MKRKSLRQILQEWKSRRTLRKFVDPEAVKKLVRGDPLETPLKQCRLEYVILFVRGDNVSEIAERVDAVVALAIKHDATVHDVVSGLVIAAFGTLQASAAQTGSRASLIEALKREFASYVKIVHGVALGFSGMLGNKQRLSYSFILPDFDRILGTLSRLQYGEIDEFQH